VENNTIKMRKVVLGRDFGQQIEVVSGVQEKEMIVTNPPDSVREGTQVNVAVPAAQTQSKYRRNQAQTPWLTAKADCASDGGHLVIPETATEAIAECSAATPVCQAMRA